MYKLLTAILLSGMLSGFSSSAFAELSADCKKQLDEVIALRTLVKVNQIKQLIKPKDAKVLLDNTLGYAEYISLSCGALSTVRFENQAILLNGTTDGTVTMKLGEKFYEEASSYFKKNK